MTLWLPPPSPAEVAKQRAEHAARILRNVTIEDARARECTDWLQEHYDDRWFMVKAHDKVEAGVPVWPGYYHVVRNNDDAPISIFPVHAGGEYVEPTSRLLERIGAGNLLNPSTFREVVDMDRKAHEQGERDIVRDQEARRAEMIERVNAAIRTQVSMNGNLAWTQNSAGRTRNGRG